MSEPPEDDAPSPLRLALLLALFLVPGAVAAAVLWHDVLNEVLAGRPMAASPLVVVAMLALMGLSVALLAGYLRRHRSGRREGHGSKGGVT